MELPSEKQRELVRDQYITNLKIHLLTNQIPMKTNLFNKWDNGIFKNYHSTKIRSLIPRPPHFGPVKYYVNGRLDKKWR